MCYRTKDSNHSIEMKRYSIILIMLLGVVTPVFTPSCTNLDEEVFDSLTAANFPGTRGELVALLASAYTNLYSFGAHNTYNSFQEISSDEAVIPHRGADWFDGGQWLRMHKHEFVATEESFNNGWNDMYRGIGICNSVIEAIRAAAAAEEPAVTQEEADSFIAETRALRALYYYWAMDAWGNIPLVTDLQEGDVQDPNPATTPRADVYNFIVSELNEVSGLLPNEKTSTTYARMNYASTQFLLAKLYLNAEVYTGTANWDAAIAACDNVINTGDYSLTSDYFANFNGDNDNGGVGTSELIFVVPYDAAQAPGFNLSQMTLHYQSQATFDLQEQPWNGYCTLAEFYNSYEDGDLRKGVSGNQQIRGNFLVGQQFASDGVTPLEDAGFEDFDPDGAPLIFQAELNELEPNALRQGGARISKYQYENGESRDSNVDFPIMRYADVLLMKAEAAFRQGDGATALTLVNQVRDRAGAAAFAEVTAENLLAERGREMFFEGWRRNDLIRFGEFGGTWDFKEASPAFRELFPIPQPKINTNVNLQQNTGY